MEATAAVPSRARVLQAFRSRNFRLLWTGQAISLLGDAAFVVALGWRTFTLTGSARSLGLVLTFQGVGVLTTVLVGGALADRYDRRTLMLVSDAARFVIVGLLVVVDATGHLAIGNLCVIAFVREVRTVRRRIVSLGLSVLVIGAALYLLLAFPTEARAVVPREMDMSWVHVGLLVALLFLIAALIRYVRDLSRDP